MSRVESGYEQIGVAMTCRSFLEYERMFSLGPKEFGRGPILDVAGGASSFVAEAASRGIAAFAADPLYAMEPEAIHRHGEAEIETSTNKLSKIEGFDWTFYGDLEGHRAMRESSLQQFINDYRADVRKERYAEAKLPDLPFADNTFTLVLCSHFLFLYHEQFDYDFHLQAVKELLRVCRPGGEVRIYPVYTLQWARYPYLEQLHRDLADDGATVILKRSQLPFIPGSEELFCVKKDLEESVLQVDLSR